MGIAPSAPAAIVDLVPFILVADVERSIPFYEALGFNVVKRHEPDGRVEFAGLEATPAAKLMLARVDEVPETGPDAQAPGFLYLYTSNLRRFATGCSPSATTRTRSRTPGPGTESADVCPRPRRPRPHGRRALRELRRACPRQTRRIRLLGGMSRESTSTTGGSTKRYAGDSAALHSCRARRDARSPR
jgi:hypothetical protein